MSDKQMPKGWLASDNPTVIFEDNAIGRMKKELWEASDEEIEAVLKEYGMPPLFVPPLKLEFRLIQTVVT